MRNNDDDGGVLSYSLSGRRIPSNEIGTGRYLHSLYGAAILAANRSEIFGLVFRSLSQIFMHQVGRKYGSCGL